MFQKLHRDQSYWPLMEFCAKVRTLTKRWRTTNPVATLNLQTDSRATYNGDIKVDEYGTSTVVIDKNVTWNGAYDVAGTGKQTTVIVSGVWNMTEDSNVHNVIIKEGGVINRNGHQLTTK